MLKQGDVREDGFVFKSRYKTRDGQIKEHWLSPEAFISWKQQRNTCNQISYHKNIENERARSKNYRANNRDKANARMAKRRASKRNAAPSWLSKHQINEISEFYLMAKELANIFPWKQEVDHIEPLQGKDICGLHVPWNLQIVPMVTNRSKGIKRGV